MILLIGDLHCRYSLVNRVINVAENRFGQKITVVIQLGDFGLFKRSLALYFKRGIQKSFIRPLFFIEGNHEDFIFFDTLIEEYSHKFTYLPRGSLHRFNNLNFLCLGGAAYMDPVNTPPGSVILDKDIEASLSHASDTVDIIITHDCPSGIGIQGTPGFEYCGQTGFEKSHLIREKFPLKTWLFAHHHRFFEHTDKYGRCLGLPEAHNGFAVMDENGLITLVEHKIKENDG